MSPAAAEVAPSADTATTAPETVEPTAFTAPEPAVARKYGPSGWDGIERTLSAAAAGVDINTASAAELESLPGVGTARARDIVGFRERFGRFETIYDLSRVPGIGAGAFRQMTGLSLTTGHDRHEILNRLLGFEPAASPPLAEVLRTLHEQIGARGIVLSGLDGMPLAQSGVPGAQAEEYAALSSQLFRRTSRYLRPIAGGDVDCIMLPAAKPALLLFATDNAFLVIAHARDVMPIRNFKKAQAAARELGWLLSRRAVARSI